MCHTGVMTRQSRTLSNGRRLQSQSVADDLAKRIEEGQLQNGDRLASELELAQEFEVARGTMRNALDILKARKMVTTKPGVGSFVSYHGHSMSKTWGWTQATADTGSPTSTELLDCDKVSAPEELRRAYRVQTDMYRIVRRRVCVDKPISVEVSYLPSNHILNLLMERGLLDDSISLTMEAAGMHPVSGIQDAKVTEPPKAYRSQLEAQDGERFLEVERASFDEDGQLVEFVSSYLNPDHFSLHVEFGRLNNDNK